MYKKIFYGGCILIEKGKNDTYNPPTFTSSNYKNWIAILDIKLCVVCRSQHGKIYTKSENPIPYPPIHQHCRCSIQPMKSVLVGNATKDGQNGADWYLRYFGVLPNYYIDEIGLKKLGWKSGDKPSKYAPGKMFTKGVYDNFDNHLPVKPGRIWYEADINYTPGKRNKHRILWSNDGLMFVTYDHYMTFYEIV